MLTLHHLKIGRSIFTAWLIEELNLEYHVEFYHRDPNTFRAGDDLKSIHPLGKSPVIQDDDLVLAESGAICSYLMAKHDNEYKLHPDQSDMELWAKYQQWLHYPEASVFGPLLMQLIEQKAGQAIEPFHTFSLNEIKLHLAYINNELAEKPYIMGQSFSGADIGMTYVLSGALKFGFLADYPKLQQYVQRNLQRDAYQGAVVRVGE